MLNHEGENLINNEGYETQYREIKIGRVKNEDNMNYVAKYAYPIPKNCIIWRYMFNQINPNIE